MYFCKNPKQKMPQNTLEPEFEERKELYDYQKGDIDAILSALTTPLLNIIYYINYQQVVGKQ